MSLASSPAGVPEMPSKASNPILALTILTVIFAINLMDRQIITVLAQSIKEDLDLSDTQLGLLTGTMFSVFYVTFGFPMAALADRRSRVKLIAACCATWSVFTAVCGLGTNFLQLALARIGVAIGEAGGAPASYSLLTDYFERDKRALAMTIVTLGSPIGVMAGAFIAGMVGSRYGWQTAFFVASVPGLILAATLLLVVREPQRGRLDAPSQRNFHTGSAWAFIRDYARNPYLLRATLGGCTATFLFTGLFSWLPPYMMRAKGMTLAEVGAYYSIALGVATIVGQLGGGLVATRLARVRQNALATVPAWGFLLSLPFFLGAMVAPQWPIALVLFAAALMCGLVYVGPTPALIQDAVPPNRRSLAAAIFVFSGNIIGLGLGPLYVGMISDFAGADGLMVGLFALTPFFLLAAGLYFWAAAAQSRAALAGAPSVNEPLAVR
jgi:predicted MFS family arabinose efflux permease